MAIIDDRTSPRDYLLPNAQNSLQDDVGRLRQAIAAIDDDVTNLLASVASKLNTSAYTAADVLVKLLTVDGGGSSIDADLLDGVQGSGYAAVAHAHDNVYAALSHVHTGLYAPVSHSHIDYSLTNHNHDGTYAVVGHLHTGVYAPSAHTHSYDSLTGKPVILSRSRTFFMSQS